MTLGGWIIMLISVSSVTSLFCWCIYKVLSTPEEEEKMMNYVGHTDCEDLKP